ncbi:MAG TPA: transglycosylase domain-containing protein [Gaiellaceae bacterium]|nr:transglycosylase domain-containing protein [Gaiellaceae bacterium]
MSPRRGPRPKRSIAPSGGRSRRARIRGRRRSRRNTVAVVLVAAFGIPAVLVLAGFGATAAFKSSCSLSSLRPVSIGQNSFVYAADGTLLGSIPAERNRQPVPLSRINPWMAKAVIATEDRRFYEHGGVDYWGIFRAAWRDLTKGKVVEGGSTITQQVVRNLYPVSRERTLQRKIKEACLAIKLSKHWSKDRILATWMNQVYFGNHAYGVEAASQTYFSKPASDLTMMQAALLAGLPQAPSLYDPIVYPEVARARRAHVLQALYTSGDISESRYRQALADRSLHLKPGRLYTQIRQPYFFSYVRDQLIDAYGAQTVQSGGLRVYTTIDPAFQRAATRAIKDTLYLKDDPAAALVSINPANGAIRAMTSVYPGGIKNEFNLVAQARRQAGSTFKTFVLTQAVDDGMNPASTSYVSAPFDYPGPPPWTVSTYSHTYSGLISVQQATLQSDNTVYAKLTLDVGPQHVADMAHKLGVQSPLEPVPSIGLGSNAVSPLDMASAYATLAAGGIYSRPMAIRKVILANGREDDQAGWGRPRRSRVIPDWVASVVTDILQKNVLYGTGTGANFGRPAAGKTGTTDDHADAWFCGYLPNLEATVWVGYPQGEIPMLSVHGIAVAGGSFPAEIWRRFMEQAVRYSPPQEFPEPSTPPEFRTFKQGPWAYAGAVPETTSTETTTTTKTRTQRTTTERTTTEEATVTVEPTTAPVTSAPPPPPVTTAPATTEVPPPPPPPPTTEETTTVTGPVPP